jgi:NTP pyrophosphatase (non-canonical NTP hydrolase)
MKTVKEVTEILYYKWKTQDSIIKILNDPVKKNRYFPHAYLNENATVKGNKQWLIPEIDIINIIISDRKDIEEAENKLNIISSFDMYQEKAADFANYKGFNDFDKLGLIYPALGLVGESGEVAEKVKRLLRNEILSEKYKEEIAKELGDVLWYVAELARKLKFKLSDIAKMNIDKLEDRKQRNKINGNGDNR